MKAGVAGAFSRSFCIPIIELGEYNRIPVKVTFAVPPSSLQVIIS